jgi:hypothetical protein
MTAADVKARIAAIREAADDGEVAHSLEDDLWRDVLRAIAAGAGDPRALAAAALKTTRLGFARHCA